MGRRTILLIEDEERLREVLVKHLDLAGYLVVAVSNGRDALQLLDQSRFDLIVTDIIMPDVDGLEVIASARERYPQIPIIAMSGGGYVSVDRCLALARTLGSSATLEKPFSSHELLAAIEPVLDSR